MIISISTPMGMAFEVLVVDKFVARIKNGKLAVAWSMY